MGKYAEIFEWFKKCPEIKSLWCVSAEEEAGANVIFPQGASIKAMYSCERDVTGEFECSVTPYNSYYEDFQINCYRIFDSSDKSSPKENINVLSLEEVQSVCDWVENQNSENALPKLTGNPVFAVECNPSVPQIRHIDPQTGIIAYFITVRLYFVNLAEPRSFNVQGNS